MSPNICSVHEVETARLRLRMFTPEDLDGLAPIFADEKVVKYLGTGQALDRAETDVALKSIIAHWYRHGFGRWAVVDKLSGKLIGYGGLRMLIDEPELVYLLERAYWGRGLATEIARAALRYGFEEHNFRRIVAIIKAGNLASRHVLEKVGMSFEKQTAYYGYDVLQFEISRGSYRSDGTPFSLTTVRAQPFA